MTEVVQLPEDTLMTSTSDPKGGQHVVPRGTCVYVTKYHIHGFTAKYTHYTHPSGNAFYRLDWDEADANTILSRPYNQPLGDRHINAYFLSEKYAGFRRFVTYYDQIVTDEGMLHDRPGYLWDIKCIHADLIPGEDALTLERMNVMDFNIQDGLQKYCVGVRYFNLKLNILLDIYCCTEIYNENISMIKEGEIKEIKDILI